MKTVIIALSALIAATPAVLAQSVSAKPPAQQHHAKKHARVVYAPRHALHARGYPGAFGYAPGEPKDPTYEATRNAGGGGGGGGGGSGM